MLYMDSMVPGCFPQVVRRRKQVTGREVFIPYSMMIMMMIVERIMVLRDDVNIKA